MKFSPLFLKKLNSLVKISDIASKNIKLTKKGKDYFGLCPFHHEKTSSFSVSNENNLYYCFGCGAGGSVFDLIQKTRNLSFAESVECIAKEHNITLPQANNSQQYKEEEEIKKINSMTLRWFEKNLFSNEGLVALNYLSSRSITRDLISRFNIGYALQDKTALLDYLSSLGYSLKSIKNAGLITEISGRTQSKFRGRIIFSIINHHNEVIGFGGRSLNQNISPKYLNSPETSVFKKKYTLYGENFIFNSTDKIKDIFVVEGYTDAIAMYRANVKNSVATLGTAISEHHIKKLWKVTNEPVICMDGDAAGHNAAKRISETVLPMLSSGYSINFVRMPKNQDPDDIIKISGTTSLREILDQRVPLCEMLWTEITSTTKTNTPERKALLNKKSSRIIEKISDHGVREHYRRFFKDKIFELYSKKYNTRLNQKHESQKNTLNYHTKINKIESLCALQRYGFALATIILEMPLLLKEPAVFENVVSINSQNAVLDSIYKCILDTCSEIEITEKKTIDEEKSKFSKAFRETFTQKIDKNILEFLSNKNSYFFDRFSSQDFNSMVVLWNKTFEHYSLEILRKEYQKHMEKADDKSMEIAMHLRHEILSKSQKLMERED